MASRPLQLATRVAGCGGATSAKWRLPSQKEARMIAKINYLSEIDTTTGRVHQGWANGVRYDLGRAATRKVESVLVDIGDDLPVAVHVSWGDRDESYRLPVWTDADDNGISMCTPEPRRDNTGCEIDGDNGGDVRARNQGYATDALPPWADAFRAVVARIRAAAAEAEATRPDVAAACEDYREVVRQIDREHARHYAQWSLDVRRIARAFRRARVEVGEQTVPGKCCVRSSRGKLLGYANIWNGAWRGTVERLA